MIEQWRRIVGFNGAYEVSSLGAVRSPNGVLRPGRTKNGYMTVSLCGRSHYVHRLVAECFCEKTSDECSDVNHKDSRRDNNVATNLEWVTRRENLRHAVDAGRFIGKLKPIWMSDDSGEWEMGFPSISAAAKFSGVVRANIQKCLRGNRNKAGGFIWRSPSTGRQPTW